jgi:hypothetical protein
MGPRIIRHTHTLVPPPCQFSLTSRPRSERGPGPLWAYGEYGVS